MPRMTIGTGLAMLGRGLAQGLGGYFEQRQMDDLAAKLFPDEDWEEEYENLKLIENMFGTETEPFNPVPGSPPMDLSRPGPSGFEPMTMNWPKNPAMTNISDITGILQPQGTPPRPKGFGLPTGILSNKAPQGFSPLAPVNIQQNQAAISANAGLRSGLQKRYGIINQNQQRMRMLLSNPNTRPLAMQMMLQQQAAQTAANTPLRGKDRWGMSNGVIFDYEQGKVVGTLPSGAWTDPNTGARMVHTIGPNGENQILSLTEGEEKLEAHYEPYIEKGPNGEWTEYLGYFDEKRGKYVVPKDKDGNPIPVGTNTRIERQIGGDKLLDSVLGKFQEEYIRKQALGLTLRHVRDMFKPEYLTYGGKLTAWVINQADKFSMKLSGDIRGSHMEKMAFYKSAYEVINRYIKEITGAQLSAREYDRLVMAMPNPKEDSPSAYWWKLNHAIALNQEMIDFYYKLLAERRVTSVEEAEELALGEWDNKLEELHAEWLLKPWEAEGGESAE